MVQCPPRNGLRGLGPGNLPGDSDAPSGLRARARRSLPSPDPVRDSLRRPGRARSGQPSESIPQPGARGGLRNGPRAAALSRDLRRLLPVQAPRQKEPGGAANMAERRRHKKRIQVAWQSRGSGAWARRKAEGAGKTSERAGGGRMSRRGRGAVMGLRRGRAAGRSSAGSAGRRGREGGGAALGTPRPAPRSFGGGGPGTARRGRPPPERGRGAPGLLSLPRSSWRCRN